MNTNNKHIIIAVSGSIAAYKTCELVRNLTKKGQNVTVLMTENAKRFVTPLTFQALSGNPVFSDSWDEGMQHIDLKNSASLFAVIPATADVIGKFANGIADNLVTSTYLALNCPVIVAPAMNPQMYSHRAVQRNLALLREDGVTIINPEEGEVVCGDIGTGKLADIQNIEKLILSMIQI